MLGRTYDKQDCSAARALEIVGERWSLLIVRDAAFNGHTRFGQFLKSLGIASNILAARLDTFVKCGIFAMEPREGSLQNEYRLTAKGKALVPVLVALARWGDDWATPGGPPAALVHKGCGGAVEQKIRCRECGSEVPCTDVAQRRLRPPLRDGRATSGPDKPSVGRS